MPDPLDDYDQLDETLRQAQSELVAAYNQRFAGGSGKYGPFGPSLRTLGPAASRAAPRASGGQIIMRTSGLKVARQKALTNPRSVRNAMNATAQQMAERLQATLQGALAAEYTRAATGRFARSIRVGVVTGGTERKPITALQIKAIPYRETKFLTNLGGLGQFKDFPVGPYRIYAKGAQSRSDLTSGKLGGRGLAQLITAQTTRGGVRVSVHRLKVPRSGNFFIAGRQPGRGGGESRILTTSGPQPAWAKTGFFYPLWVNHPGFKRDLLSELAIAAGSTYQEEVLRAVGDRTTLTSTAFVASGRIPIAAAQAVRTDIPEGASVVVYTGPIPKFLRKK